MKVEDLWYLGGLIDADGHVGLHKAEEGRYVPSLSFVNTSKDLIDLFEACLGGNTYVKHKMKPTHTDTYEIVIRKNDDFLRAAYLIEPYLRIKRKKLLVAIQYAESIRDLAGRNRTPEVQAHRESLRQLWENTAIEG